VYAISFEELDQLCGEVLPERAVLSTMQPPTTISYGGGHGTTVFYACQYTQQPGPPALLAALGLAPTSPGYTMSCIPAGMVTY
jgi:hypothetical protein